MVPSRIGIHLEFRSETLRRTGTSLHAAGDWKKEVSGALHHAMLRVPGCQKSVRPQNNTTSVDSHKMEVVEMYQYMYIYIYIYMELTNARVWQTSICDDLPLLYTTIYTILIYSSIKICSSLCLVLLQFNPIINYIGAVYRLPMFFLLQGPRNWLLWSPRPPTQAAASGKLLISCLLGMWTLLL